MTGTEKNDARGIDSLMLLRTHVPRSIVCRRRGVASRMLKSLLSLIGPVAAERLTVRVPSSSAAASNAAKTSARANGKRRRKKRDDGAAPAACPPVLTPFEELLRTRGFERRDCGPDHTSENVYALKVSMTYRAIYLSLKHLTL